jgi:hypothetical protein
MKYVKGILIGLAAFIATVIASGAIATFVMIRYPQFAMRIFPRQSFDLQWGTYYYVDFPLWYIIATGAVASIIAFAWMLKRSTARTA